MARKNYSDKVVSLKTEEILDAAMLVLESGAGIDAVSFRKVASILNCSYATPYRYFSSKDELLTALRVRAFRWIQQQTTRAIDPKKTSSENLEAMARAYISAGIHRPDLYQLMFFELKDIDFGERTAELNQAKRDSLNVCTGIIIDGQKSAEFSASINPLTASHIFWVAAHGLVSLQIANQFVMGKTIDELIPVLVHSTVIGLKTFDRNSTEKRSNIEFLSTQSADAES